MDRTMRQVTEQQLNRARGDYSPDPKADRFPALVAPTTVPKKVAPEGLTIRSLFALWERDHLANGKSARTVGDFRQKIESLVAFLGHDDALLVTPEKISDWCEHLRHTNGLAARTVSQKYLSVAKLVFRLAVEKRKLKENPADSLQVRFTKPERTRSKGFTDEEALIILKAALKAPLELERWSPENKRAVQWGPWMCAFTGGRIAELMQMRTEDLLFEKINGEVVPCMRITPEAGSVKTGNFRVVPIHPQLQELGLVTMIQSLPPGPIFYSTDFKKKAADPVARSRNAGAKVWAWIREVVKITDDRIQPNHAWRHRFKTEARDADIPPEYMNAIQGHNEGTAAAAYGEVTLKVLWREVQKMPHFDLSAAD